MSSHSFILAEAALVVGGLIVFFAWQMRSLNRDIAASKAREQAQRDEDEPRKTG